jgi:hypothetical protein
MELIRTAGSDWQTSSVAPFPLQTTFEPRETLSCNHCFSLTFIPGLPPEMGDEIQVGQKPLSGADLRYFEGADVFRWTANQ